MHPAFLQPSARGARYVGRATPALGRCRAQRSVSASAEESAAAPAVFTIPTGPEAAIKQAERAIVKAFQGGSTRQRVDLLLPLLWATDLDDWPGGIRQQFHAAKPLVETILKNIKQQEGLEGRLEVEILDQGDAVAVWKSNNLLVVLFPTGQTLGKIQEMAAGKRLVIMINPQWTGGQVVSDFGLFGRKKKEDFVNSFDVSYSLVSKRMCGEDIRTLTMDSKTQLFVREGSSFTFVDEYAQLPKYFDLEKILMAREGSVAAMSLLERVQSEMAFNANSLKSPPK